VITHYAVRQVPPDVTVVTLQGSLTRGRNLGRVERQLQKLVADGSRKLVLDFSDLTSIDSAGLGLLLVCTGTMEQAGGQFAVAGAAGKTKQILEMARLQRVVSVYPDLTTALAALDDRGHRASEE
jgi:anti-anti-sigma factor